VSALRTEIESRFPEVRNALDEEDGDYTLMHRVIEWLRSVPPVPLSADIVDRVRRFKQWCEDQPRMQGAEDDMWTIFIVGFWEHLFESDFTRALIPHLMSFDEVVENRAYLESLVGADNYQMAMREYDQTV
jgi:hypothetical protein